MSEQNPTDPKQLTTIFKKNGNFDKQRKILLDEFKQSNTYKNLLLKLQIIIERKIKSDPSILTKNRGKMAALIQGEIISNHNKDMKEASDSHHTEGILSVIEKDIQSRVSDSTGLQQSIHLELARIKREVLGITEEEERAMIAETTKPDVYPKYSSRSKMHINLNSNYRISKPSRLGAPSNRYTDHQAKEPPAAQDEKNTDQPDISDLMY